MWTTMFSSTTVFVVSRLYEKMWVYDILLVVDSLVCNKLVCIIMNQMLWVYGSLLLHKQYWDVIGSTIIIIL